jgi:hypothetical protein
MTNDARCKGGSKSSISTAKLPENGIKFKEETCELLYFEHTLYKTETWTLRKID